MRQRLLAEDVLAHFQGRHGHDRVIVIRRGDHHGVDALLRVQHLAKVAVAFGLGELLLHVSHAVGIHVAHGHHVFRRDVADVARPIPPGPTLATFNLLLADGASAVPKTCRGMIVNDATVAVLARN